MSRTLRRLIPSPAMIVALVALVMSLGSSAYALGLINSAQIEDDSVRGVDVKERSLHGHDLGKNSVGRLAINESRLREVRAKGLRFWAVITQGGGLDRGSKRLTDGDVSKVGSSPDVHYVVDFHRDVRPCSYQATIGSEVDAVPENDSQVTVSREPGNFNAVRVRTATGPNTASGKNTAAPMPFQLAVTC
jgi:hypothetical protein